MGSSFIDRQNQLSGSLNYNSLAGIENKYINNGVTEYLIEEYGQ